MKTLEEMRARLAEITERLGEIHTEAGEATLGEERQTEWDGLDTEYDTLRSKIEKAEKRAERMAELADSSPAHVEETRDRRPAPGARKPENIYDVDEIRSRAYDADDFRGLLRDNAMRAVENANYARTARKSDAQERVEDLINNVDNDAGDLAKRLLATGSPVYERAYSKVLRALNTNMLSNEERNAMSLGTDAQGGYAVPFQLDPSVILTNDGQINPLREMARVVEITGKEWQGVTSAGITVSRDAEAEEVSDDGPSLAQPTVRAERVQGFVPFSIEIDADWNQFRSEMSMMLKDAKEREEATSFVIGTGVSPNANGVVSTLNASSYVSSTSAGTSTAAFAVEDLYLLEESLPPRFRGANAEFLANHGVYNDVRQFGTSDGHALWERIGAGQPPELLGYKAREASAMSSSTATADELILLFGDFKNFLIVDRVGMSVELVPHLFGAATAGQQARPTGQRGIYAIWRNNSKVLVDNAFRLLQIKA